MTTALDTFAQSCTEAIVAAKQALTDGETLTLGDVRKIIVEQAKAANLSPKRPRKKATDEPPPPRPRNFHFDALAAAFGYPEKPTKAAARTIGAALAEIREVDPLVTPQELTRRAALVRRRYDKAGVMALSAHWHEFGGGDKTKSARLDIYAEPAGWKTSEKARTAFNASPESWALIVQRGWFDLSPDIRADILRAML
jgi:hypothetical protein